MFSCASDASKVALVKLIQVIESRGIELIDCQVANSHLTSLGSELMPRIDFVRRVETLVRRTGHIDPWHEAPHLTSRLVPAPPTPSRLRD
jgi:leucyl/phenylalanyl-tRNA--protein transferase